MVVPISKSFIQQTNQRKIMLSNYFDFITVMMCTHLPPPQMGKSNLHKKTEYQIAFRDFFYGYNDLTFHVLILIPGLSISINTKY